MPARGSPRRPGVPRRSPREHRGLPRDTSIPEDTSILVDTSILGDTSHGVQRTRLWGPRADAELSVIPEMPSQVSPGTPAPKSPWPRGMPTSLGTPVQRSRGVSPGAASSGPPPRRQTAPPKLMSPPPPHQVRLVPQLSGAVSSLCFQGLVPERELPGDPGLRHHHPAPGPHEAAG